MGLALHSIVRALGLIAGKVGERILGRGNSIVENPVRIAVYFKAVGA
jgi:hypothetical protein